MLKALSGLVHGASGANVPWTNVITEARSPTVDRVERLAIDVPYCVSALIDLLEDWKADQAS
ncbi:hypothetical protein [Micromonospora foliorum]|uniref:hypothetical protein n=1 Tax=Micromonospora foliorum TaxID=2911210 RepID=UPI001EE85FE2|nr:hypothetical protein [Micromonospora foliorum]MCG5436308.1 hypothetical protein [Micromonospora foliorum]